MAYSRTKHRFNSWILSAFFALFFSTFSNSQSVSWGGQWFSLSSEHFDIHYPKGLEEKARQALDIAENVHQDLTPFFGYEPKHKTQITLVDDFDFSNGWASPLPFSQIRLFASPPSSINSLENYSSWLYMLIRHEYVHILHFNLVKGIPKVGQSLLGRHAFFFPHLLLPSMFSEGLAVYLESLPEGSGRLSGSYYPMLMKSQVAHRHILDLTEVVIDSPYFNSSEAYLYGAYFVTFLAQNYGEEKLKQFLDNYADATIPYFFLNSTAKQVYGKDFSDLWVYYKHWLRHRFENKQAEFLKLSDASAQISASSMQILSASDGKNVYFSSNNGVDQPKLSIHKGEQNFTSAYRLVSFDAHKKYGIAGIKTNTYPTGEVLNDLYLLDGSSWKRITYKQRISGVKWLNKEKALILSSKRQGQSQLWRYSLKGEHSKNSKTNNAMQLIWQAKDKQVIGDFAVSPDDSALILMLNTQGKGWNLARLNLETKELAMLTQTKGIENAPFFIDNQRLLFSADYDFRYQIYELNLNTQEIIQRSLDAEGAFRPLIAEDGSLIYTAYHKMGYALKKVKTLKSYGSRLLSHFEGEKNMTSAAVPITDKSESKPYSVWSTIFPQQWLPIINQTQSASQWGLSTYGSDALGQHNYRLDYLYDIKNHLHAGSFTYRYDTRWLFSINQSHQLLALPDSEWAIKTHTAIQNRNWLLERRHLLNLFTDSLELRAGIISSTSEAREPQYFKIGVDTYRAKELGGLALVIKNQESYRYLPYIGRGLYWDLVAQTYDVLDSDFSGNRYQSKLIYAFDLANTYQLGLNLSVGHVHAKNQWFFLGGEDKGKEISVFLRSSPSLPGYPYGVSFGKNYAKASIDVHSVLASVNRNLSLYPVGLGDIYARIYAHTGSVWNQQEPKWLNAAGVSLNAQLKLGYRLTLPIALGVAQGLDEPFAETQFYLRLSQGF